MVWEIKKEHEKNRIVIAVTGDELIPIIPDEVMELVEDNAETGDGSAENAINTMEKGVFKFYLPFANTKVEGF